jgi:hypothetical protein
VARRAARWTAAISRHNLQVFGLVHRAASSPDLFIEYAIQEFERQLQASLAGLDSRIVRIRRRAEQLRQEIKDSVDMGLAVLRLPLASHE